MQVINERVKTNKKGPVSRDKSSNKRNFASMSPRQATNNSNLSKNEYMPLLKLPEGPAG